MESFAKSLEARLHKKITITENSRECLEGADIMVEATRLMEPMPLLKTEWIRPGNFVVPYGTICANEITLTDVMDKIVVDDWGQCREGGRLGSLWRMSVTPSMMSVSMSPSRTLFSLIVIVENRLCAFISAAVSTTPRRQFPAQT